LAPLFVLVVGGRTGIGLALATRFSRGDLDQEAPAHVVLTSRDTEGLSGVAEELQARFEMPVRTLSVDLLSPSAVEDMLSSFWSDVSLRAALEPVQVVVLACAGEHEPAVTKDPKCPSGWRYSREDDFDSDHQLYMKALNQSAPLLLLQGLIKRTSERNLWSQLDLRFAFLSSQAADPIWWPKGNSLYGPQKHQAEQGLRKLFDNLPNAHQSRLSLFCLRYPFVESKMAHKLYEELLQVEDLPPKSEIFAPIQLVAEETFQLILRGSSSRFTLILPSVYQFSQ
jgi:NAD(P)-dependent dehydrogenase (short-subunit alcohol dehydrogenase family)